MEKKLRKLFDYQHFENNPKLAGLIAETEKKLAVQLSDDELYLVSAAGDIYGKDYENR